MFETSVLLFAGFGLFFAPGLVFLRFGAKAWPLSAFEKTLCSVALSFGFIDVTFLVLNHLQLPLSALTLLIGLTLFVTLAILCSLLIRHFFRSHDQPSATVQVGGTSFSRRSTWLFILLIGLTFFVKTLYLSSAVLPTATDLGHHMYWAKLITETGVVPDYAKIEVVLDEAGRASVTNPRPIADFIVGEHLPFAALAMLSGLNFFGAGPILMLFFLNLLSLLAILTLAWRAALSWEKEQRLLSSESLVLVTFLFLGPLSTLASPQMKFVSGGVVGNVFGNFFIPVILLLFFRALLERRAGFLALALSLSAVLAYTHHLSTLVLVFILSGSLFLFLALHWQRALSTLLAWGKLWRAPEPWIVLTGIGLFMATIALPSYLDPGVIGEAIGTPTKTTRTGLSFAQASNTVGLAKMAFALAGLVLLIGGAVFRRSLAGAFFIGWSGMLLGMTLFPHFFLLDIPSNRIGSYLVFPFTLVAAVGLVALLHKLAETWMAQSHFTFVRLPLLLGLVLVVVATFVLTRGHVENADALPDATRGQAVAETFGVSRYLATTIAPTDLVLKDHNYIPADAWMKLFFLRDYGFPLSRGFFSRYAEGGSRRERCTLAMIATPNTDTGRRCFAETGVNLIVVNPEYDAVQFEKSRDFSRVYASPHIQAFKRASLD